MKTMIALGLVILSLALVVGVRRNNTNQHPVPGGEPASPEPQPISRAVPAHRIASQMLRTTRQAQSVHAILVAAIEAETDSDRRNEARERALESVSDAELPGLLDSLARDTIPAAAEMSQLLVRRWAESDAPAAAAWAMQFPEDSTRSRALEQVAIAWANSDPASSLAWLRALPDGESKQVATLAAAYEAARADPITALDLTSPLSPTLQRDDLLVHAVSQWAEADSTAAVSWAMRVPDPALRERLVAAVAVALAELDGAAAASLAANVLGAGDEQNRTTVSIVQRWVQNSPPAAAAWVSQFPDIPPRAAAVENLLAFWTTQNAEAAGNWLCELPAGSMRDFGITTYVRALADQERTSTVVAPTGAR